MKKLWRKFRQAVDRAIYEGRFKQFIWLGGILVVSFVVMLFIAKIAHFDPQHPHQLVLTPEQAADSAYVAENPTTAIRVIELMLDPGSFTGGHKYGQWGLQLFIVLVGATLFTSFLIGAIGNLLNRRIESLTKGQYTYDFEDHVLILGSSSILVSLVEQLGGISQDVVILTERDPELVREALIASKNTKVKKHTYVIFGKRTDKASLKNLRVSKASRIYIIGEDDEKQHDGLNLECWQCVKEMSTGGPTRKDCYLVIDRLTTRSIFSYRNESCSTSDFRLNIVCAVENMAQGVLVSRKAGKITYPAIDRDGITVDSDINVHMIIVGMTQVGYAMATTAAHICHFPNFATKKKKTKITFIQKNIKEELDYWMGRYDSLMDLSYAECLSWDDSGKLHVKKMYPKQEYNNPFLSDDKGFLDVEWEFIDAGVEDMNVREYIRRCVAEDGKSEYLSFAFCAHEAEDNVAASLFLPKEVFAKKDIPVFVYQPLTKWVLATANKASRYSNLYPFGIRKDSFDPEQERILWAKRINYIYKKNGVYDSMGTDEELDAIWYDSTLHYAKQQSNVYAANSVPVKFRSIGLNPEERSTITRDEVEILAEVEHNRWNVERLLIGYSALPYKIRMDLLIGLLSADSDKAKETKSKKNRYRDNEFMHADIAPFDELLHASKQYDIDIVANLLDVIKN